MCQNSLLVPENDVYLEHTKYINAYIQESTLKYSNKIEITTI